MEVNTSVAFPVGRELINDDLVQNVVAEKGLLCLEEMLSLAND